MRITRTSGVSDTVVKPRRGISLRDVRVVPKPKVDTAKKVRDLNQDPVVGQVFAGRGVMQITGRTNPVPHPHSLTEFVPHSEYRWELDGDEIDREHRASLVSIEQLIEYRIGPPAEGHTRTIERNQETFRRRHTLFVRDFRAGYHRRVDYENWHIRVPYEVIEDTVGRGVMRGLELRNVDIRQARAIIRHYGYTVPPNFNTVEIFNIIQTREYEFIFSTR